MNKIVCLWVPVAFMVIQLILEMTLPARTLALMQTENGPHELLEFLLILAAFIVVALTLFQMDKAQKPLVAWLALAAVCCFYVAGEEISWGQHFLDWTTPEFWDAVNDQHETNLHNTSSWLDQKPRLLLEIGVISGGLILPLLLKYKPQWVPARFTIIYPPPQLAPIALIGIGAKIIAKLSSHIFGIILFERVSEVEELYLYYFVLLYLLAMRSRVLKR